MNPKQANSVAICDRDIVWFAHGSNMKKRLFRKRFGPWRRAEKALLKGYRLRWSGNTNTLVRSPKSRVYGVAYWVSRNQLEKIESVVKERRVWKRIGIELIVGERPLKAITHVLASRRPTSPPSRRHLKVLLQGLREHGWGTDATRAWTLSARPDPK